MSQELSEVCQKIYGEFRAISLLLWLVFGWNGIFLGVGRIGELYGLGFRLRIENAQLSKAYF